MGFYGNITNTAKTTFQFDRIYPNRRMMDAGTKDDGIFIGRYVLIEYENDKSKDSFLPGVNYTDDHRIEATKGNYYTYSDNAGSQYDKADITKNLVVGLDWIVYIDNTYYICSGNVMVDNTNYATFDLVTETDSIYYANYRIDTGIGGYGESKGYDSTVWIKTSTMVDDKLDIKYVNIANLNTVVPTFDLTIDAPSSEPITPHFDIDSTNVYYKLHVQPNWGFQVGQATDGKSDDFTYWTKQVKDGDGAAQTYHTEYAVLDENGKVAWQLTKPSAPSIPATIYYNKAAFEPYLGTKTVDGDNTITLLPNGYSGKKYNDHNKINSVSEQADIQQLTINLPVIGNMISDAWDIIHGVNRDDSTIDSLQGRLNFFTGKVPSGEVNENDGSPILIDEGIKANEIPVQSQNGYLVGSVINGNKKDTTIFSEIERGTVIEDSYTIDDPWITTDINVDKENEVDGETTYHKKGISIHHNFHKISDTTSYHDQNNEQVDIPEATNNVIVQPEQDTIELYTPKVDNAGHVIGKNTQFVTLPYGYKFIEVSNIEDEVIAAPAQTTGEATTADNTQDTLNIETSNRWIKVDNNDEDTVKFGHRLTDISEQAEQIYGLEKNINFANAQLPNNEFLIPEFSFDQAGHVITADEHTITIPGNISSIGMISGDSNRNIYNDYDKTESNADSFSFSSPSSQLTIGPGNSWIHMDSLKDNNQERESYQITIHHHVDKTSLDKNTTIHQTKLSGEDPEENVDYNLVAINDLLLDSAGHIAGYNTETYMLPRGYKYIFSENSNEQNFLDNYSLQYSEASKHESLLNINAQNYWIKLTNMGNTITISHAAPGDEINTAGDTTKAEPKFGSSFNTTVVKYDEAGHVSGTGTREVVLPKPSLAANGTATSKVLTGLSLTDTDGAFTYTQNDVGNMILTGYSENSIDVEKNMGIKATYNLNTGLKKLEDRIRTEEENRVKAINTLLNDEGATNVIDSFAEVAAWLSNDDNKNAASIIADINTNANAIEALAQTVEDNKASAESADSALSDRITSEVATLTQNIKSVQAAAASSLIDVKTALESKDTELQDNIDAINNRLNADYTTTGQDTTYARAENTYTKEVVDSLLQEKQDIIDDLIARIEALEQPVE